MANNLSALVSFPSFSKDFCLSVRTGFYTIPLQNDCDMTSFSKNKRESFASMNIVSEHFLLGLRHFESQIRSATAYFWAHTYSSKIGQYLKNEFRSTAIARIKTNSFFGDYDIMREIQCD